MLFLLWSVSVVCGAVGGKMCDHNTTGHLLTSVSLFVIIEVAPLKMCNEDISN